MRLWCGLSVLMVLVTACDSSDSTQRPLPVRPVSVYELTTRDYPKQRTVTGVVSLYREEQVGFEIGGRVTMVLDEGFEVRGPAYDDRGERIRQGEPVAAMEGTRYGSQVGALQAQLDATRRDLQAMAAQVTLARQTLERQQSILAEGAGAQQAVDDAQSAYDQATASLAARRAAVRGAEQQLNSAAEDLGDAVLHAPFSGRVTAVHIAEGAVVNAGTPVVTLTLMDPVQIQVDVSADDERDIETGNRAVIFPKDPFDADRRIPVNAIVYEKSAVADPKLRTFRIELITRNLRRHVHERDPELHGLPNINEYLPVVRQYQGEEGPLFVASDAVLDEGGESYVLRLPGVSFHEAGMRDAVGKHTPERVEVKLGDQFETVVNWNFRNVEDDGALVEGDFLILNPQPEYVNGISIGRPQWLLRPRDLVPVQFDLSRDPRGMYVPSRAIVLIGEEAHVYRLEEGVARAHPVTLHEMVDEYRRVESDALSDGDQIVVAGVHYIADGQPVSVSKVLE